MTSRCLLLTGADGFVGTAIKPLLSEAGYEVHAVVRPGARGGDSDTTHECDLTDLPAIDALCARVRATHLLHLAWCTGLADHKTSIENLRWVASGARLLDAFRRNGGLRAVAAGTYVEYGNYAGVCTDQTPAAPTFLYAAAKAALGALMLAYADADGYSATWARLFILYGTDEPKVRLIPQISEALATGKPFETSDGTQVRDFVHVSDAARALVTLLGVEHRGVVNVGTGVGRPIRDVIIGVSERIGRPELVRLGTRERSPEESIYQIADPRPLHDMGWVPEISFERGLHDEVDSIAAAYETYGR